MLGGTDPKEEDRIEHKKEEEAEVKEQEEDIMEDEDIKKALKKMKNKKARGIDGIPIEVWK